MYIAYVLYKHCRLHVCMHVSVEPQFRETTSSDQKDYQFYFSLKCCPWIGTPLRHVRICVAGSVCIINRLYTSSILHWSLYNNHSSFIGSTSRKPTIQPIYIHLRPINQTLYSLWKYMVADITWSFLGQSELLIYPALYVIPTYINQLEKKAFFFNFLFFTNLIPIISTNLRVLCLSIFMQKMY